MESTFDLSKPLARYAICEVCRTLMKGASKSRCCFADVCYECGLKATKSKICTLCGERVNNRIENIVPNHAIRAAFNKDRKLQEASNFKMENARYKSISIEAMFGEMTCAECGMLPKDAIFLKCCGNSSCFDCPPRTPQTIQLCNGKINERVCGSIISFKIEDRVPNTILRQVLSAISTAFGAGLGKPSRGRFQCGACNEHFDTAKDRNDHEKDCEAHMRMFPS